MLPQEDEFMNVLNASRDRLWRLCRVYATDHLEPQDLYQEVVFQLWRSFPDFDGRAQRATWVYRVALNTCLRQQLQWKRRHHARLDALAPDQLATAPAGAAHESYERLRQCVAALPDADRAVVVPFLEGMSYRQIGEITGLTENHVAVKMKRIKLKLKPCLLSDYHD